jgi:hypothetical protein
MRRSALIKKRAIRAFCIAGGQEALRGDATSSRNAFAFNTLSSMGRTAQFLMKH